jgi:hypothetical protein
MHQKWAISRGKKCYTRDGVLMITCIGVLVITVTEFVRKLLYILQKHSSKMVILIFRKWVLGAKLNFNDKACLTYCIMCQQLISSPLALNQVVLSIISKLFANSQILTCLFQVFILAIHNYLIIMQNCKHKARLTNLYQIFQMSRSSCDNSKYVLEFLWYLLLLPMRFLC